MNGLKIRARGGAILTVLDSAEDPLSGKDIYFRAKSLNPSLTMSTINRMVCDLAKAGLVQKLKSAGPARYVRADRMGHHHLVDIRTGATSKFDSPDIEDAVRAAAAELGIKLSFYRLELIFEPSGSRRTQTTFSPRLSGRV